MVTPPGQKISIFSRLGDIGEGGKTISLAHARETFSRGLKG